MLGGATRVARLGTGVALGSSPRFCLRLRCLFLLITRCVLQNSFLEQPHVRCVVPLEARLDSASAAFVFLLRVRAQAGQVLHAFCAQPCRLSEQFLSDGVASVWASRRSHRLLPHRHFFDSFTVHAEVAFCPRDDRLI